MSKETTTAAIPYMIQGNNIILVIDGKSYAVNKGTHPFYSKVVNALKDKNWDVILDIITPVSAIVSYGKGNITIDDDQVLWKGEVFHNAMCTRMLEMAAEGMPIEPLVNFMERLMNNPSKRSVDQLYTFLEKNKLPITEDGYFLAFKKVRSNYLDIHSGKISNRVGEVVSMPRNLVDDNPDSYCSSGLHFCGESYLPHFGSSTEPVMILKIDPADVVSVPRDYDGAKGRCCKYTVVAEVSGNVATAFSSAVNFEYPSKGESIEESLCEGGCSSKCNSPCSKTATEEVPARFKYTVLRKYSPFTVVLETDSYTEAFDAVERANSKKQAVLVVRTN